MTPSAPIGHRGPAAPASVDATTYVEVCQFLAHEAAALDDRRYNDWVELVADEFVYLVPTPRTPDTPFKPHFDSRNLLIDESKWSLTTQWFRRFDEDIYEMAWGENPPVRYRHVIGSIRVRVADDAAYTVHSNVLLTGTRQSDSPKFVSAQRTDTLVRREGTLLLARRWAVLDQVLIDFPQLRIML